MDPGVPPETGEYRLRVAVLKAKRQRSGVAPDWCHAERPAARHTRRAVSEAIDGTGDGQRSTVQDGVWTMVVLRFA